MKRRENEKKKKFLLSLRTMVLESIFQVIADATIIIGGTLVATTAISSSPFDAGTSHSWWRNWMDDLKNKDDPRNHPFSLPLWFEVILHVIIMAFFTVAFFIFQHNHGHNNGFEVHPLCLVTAIISYLLYTAWVTLRFATRGECNITFVQLLGLFFGILAFILMFRVHDLSLNAWFLLPFLLWQAYFLIKVYIEIYFKVK